jgi:ABC-2 type transport system ATP-binding protein/lipopolysaccharide transport system ATP-binding protein
VSETNLSPIQPGTVTADTAIQLDGVSVQYRIPTEKIGTFKEFIIRYMQRKVSFTHFWALNTVDLTVKRGEVFGIIGKNGAGKSTMLKAVSGVLRPTKGRVRVFGHIAPLLELGAGFHPELSGRENVFLNGSLLGYSKPAMEEVYDEIVEFSDLKPFMDAPIRTYSSGMNARLGFAVATAHFPEILIVDEVLSVGDEAFQKKCQDRMKGFQERGTTILIVSHGLNTIQDMCDRVAWLDHGKVRLVGEPEEVIAAYRAENQA